MRCQSFKSEISYRTSHIKYLEHSCCYPKVLFEMSMIDLLLLASIDTQLRKIKESSPDTTIIFNKLSLLILMDDFYQFTSVLRKTFWDKAIGEKELHEKSFWNRFTSILTLIEQIHQKTNLLFQEILKKAWDRRLDSRDVRAGNQKLAMELLTSSALNTDGII